MADSITDMETPAATVLLGPEGQLTLPEALRQAAGLELNHPVSVEVTPEGILLASLEIDPD